jgi:hypothetical protein
LYGCRDLQDRGCVTLHLLRLNLGVGRGAP